MHTFSSLLQKQQFSILIEHLTHLAPQPIMPYLAGYPCVMTLADRVHSDDDPAPLASAQHYPSEIEKILHFSGKDRDIKDFQNFLQQAQAEGLKNVLLLTGDKLKSHCFEEHRTRYLESVNAVMAAKAHGGFCIGVAFNPFKYRAAEKQAQYFKLHKKMKAGADYIITQLGYDLNALHELKDFMQQHDDHQPIFVCVMPLTLARAQFMRRAKVAGIVITDHMLAVLEQEKQQGLVEYAERRAALQIRICQHLGFAGVHLSACHQVAAQQRLETYINEYQALNLAECEALWQQLWQINTGHEFIPDYAYSENQVTRKDYLKYQQLHLMHETVFASKLAKGVGRMLFKEPIWQNKIVARGLVQAEHVSKHSVVGCESCGQCRLAETLYICPETCPKGLANGPCGGTHGDLCEFGDRECIHSVKARLAQAVGQTDQLKQQLIPTVPIEVRGSSSWKNWYLT